MQFNNEIFFLRRECASLQIWSQVVDPPKPATLPATLEASLLWHCTPASMAVFGNMAHQLLILFRGPQTLPEFLFVAARVAPHYSSYLPTLRFSAYYIQLTIQRIIKSRTLKESYGLGRLFRLGTEAVSHQLGGVSRLWPKGIRDQR